MVPCEACGGTQVIGRGSGLAGAYSFQMVPCPACSPPLFDLATLGLPPSSQEVQERATKLWRKTLMALRECLNEEELYHLTKLAEAEAKADRCSKWIDDKRAFWSDTEARAEDLRRILLMGPGAPANYNHIVGWIQNTLGCGPNPATKG